MTCLFAEFLKYMPLFDTFFLPCHNPIMDKDMNLIQRTTEFALYIARAYAKPGDTLIDATCGGGHDTLALAGMQPGKLYAFDIQPEAIDRTRSLLEESGYAEALADGTITLCCAGHEQMGAYLRGEADTDPDPRTETFAALILFNLGYLPGGDKTVTTRTDTTLAAVQGALPLLKKDGLICITMYSGHPEGAEEKRALLAFAEGLDSKRWHVSYVSMLNQKHDPPEILLISRKR